MGPAGGNGFIWRDFFRLLAKKPSIEHIFSEKKKWARQDLNLRPSGYEPDAPPD